MKKQTETITTDKAIVPMGEYAKDQSKTIAKEGLIVCPECDERFPRKDAERRRKCPKCKAPWRRFKGGGR